MYVHKTLRFSKPHIIRFNIVYCFCMAGMSRSSVESPSSAGADNSARKFRNFMVKIPQKAKFYVDSEFDLKNAVAHRNLELYIKM